MVKKNNQIRSLTVKVAKLTNHNRRLSRKLKKKDITPSFPILSSTVIETPQASTSNSEVESPKASPTSSGIASPKTMVSTLWDSLSPATQKRTTWKYFKLKITREKENPKTSGKTHREGCWQSSKRRCTFPKSRWGTMKILWRALIRKRKSWGISLIICMSCTKCFVNEY